VNWEHLRTFLWLRWRLRANQLRRGGMLNRILLGMAAVAVVLLSICGFVGGFFVAALALREVESDVIMYIWDGLILVFLFWWSVGLFAELQRSEVLSLDKFLHLPVSLSGAFLINYLSSLFSLTIFLFVPAMLGLGLGLLVAKGPAMLLLLPLVAALLLMITAVTYQFQGWLASLMVNKRRRRTIIVIATAMFVLLAQAPNLLNILQPWKDLKNLAPDDALTKELSDLQAAHARGELTPTQLHERETKAKERYKSEKEGELRNLRARVNHWASLVNGIVPLGWPALGAQQLANGVVWPSLLMTAGLTLLGAASLRRAYRTTMRFYTGQFSAGKAAPAALPKKEETAPAGRNLVEKKLPWLSEEASAVALATLQSLLRAPEAKMALLTPIILVLIFGSLFLARDFDMPAGARPLSAFGAMSAVLLSLIQMAGNQFGFERSGFRVFVLCPANRKNILLGKNLALAPVALGMGLVVVIFVQILRPMQITHFLAVMPQLVSMYVLFSLLTNIISVLAPMRLAQGSLRATNTKAIPILMHLAFMVVFPLVLGLTLLPLGVEQLVEWLGWMEGVPLCLFLALIECGLVLLAYPVLLGWEGSLLQAREKEILAVVAIKDE
jgi:hypothetical protein